MTSANLNTGRHIATAFACVAALAASARPASATTISFSASTLGCFTSGASCTPTLPTVTSNNLTFTGAVGSTTAVDADNIDTDTLSLGAFSIEDPSANPLLNPGSTTTFDLLVQFLNPLNAGSNIFSALLVGKITGGPNDSVTVDFSPNAPVLFTFSDAGGSGSFALKVANNPLITATSGSVGLIGQIQDVTYTRDGGVAGELSPVPEPTSLLLLGTGLIGAGVWGRRKIR